MKIYVLFHAGDWQGGETGMVRGIYSTAEKAEENLQSRAEDGSTENIWRHDQYCCSVEEMELDALGLETIMEPVLPLKPGSFELVPESVLSAITDLAMRTSPLYRS